MPENLPATFAELKIVLVVAAVQRRFRVRRVLNHFRLSLSRPTPMGSVSIEHRDYASLQAALDGLLNALMQQFSDQFATQMRRFDADCGAYIHGRPGVRPKSTVLRERAEAAGNHLCRMSESYAQAYLDLSAVAVAHQVVLQGHEISEWLQGGIDAIASGHAGRRHRLEDLAGGTPSG